METGEPEQKRNITVAEVTVMQMLEGEATGQRLKAPPRHQKRQFSSMVSRVKATLQHLKFSSVRLILDL